MRKTDFWWCKSNDCLEMCMCVCFFLLLKCSKTVNWLTSNILRLTKQNLWNSRKIIKIQVVLEFRLPLWSEFYDHTIQLRNKSNPLHLFSLSHWVYFCITSWETWCKWETFQYGRWFCVQLNLKKYTIIFAWFLSEAYQIFW